MKKVLILPLFLLLITSAAAHSPEGDSLKQLLQQSFHPYLQLQGWATYTVNHQVFNEENQQYQPVDNRINFQWRRARAGFMADVTPTLKVGLTTAYDLIGRDVLSGVTGGANNGGRPNFTIWDSHLSWQVWPNKDWLHVKAGYFRPQLSRESISSPWSVTSMDKSESQRYIRQHLSGTFPGAMPGMNLGGLWLNEQQNLGLIYHFGLFTPQQFEYNGNSAGSPAHPLYTARFVFQFGDPEQTQFKTKYDINYFGRRKGLSLGLSGSWQDRTSLHEGAFTLQSDMLFNWGPLNLDLDWMWMGRKGHIEGGNSFTYLTNTGHARISYHIPLRNKRSLEPVFMLSQFNGGLSLKEQQQAALTSYFAGQDHSFDAGINYYIKGKGLKLVLHYIWRSGNSGDTFAGATFNDYFYQKNTGAILRGNWLGLGVNLIVK
jgi:hypothetical protein